MSPHSADSKLPDLKQQAIAWLVLLRSESLSDDDMLAFADWLAQDYRHSQAFADAEDLFDDMTRAATSDCILHSDHQPAVAYKVRPPRVRRWLPATLAMAAVWLFTVMLVSPENAHPLDSLFSDYHSATGELREIRLSDGSQMLLDTNTAVSVNFDRSSRQIILHHGKARFNVAKDSQRPFEVVSDTVTSRALGTVFEVYRPAADQLSVTVQHHAVRVSIAESRDKAAHSIDLQTAQRLEYRHDGSAPRIAAIDLDQAMAWQQHRLLINDRPLSELIAEINRYRLGRIFVSDPKLNDLRLSGVFSLDHPDAIVQSICDVLGLQQTRLSNWWVVLHH